MVSSGSQVRATWPLRMISEGLRWQQVPLRPQLLEVLVEPLGPEGQPAAGALDVGDFEPGIAVEDALADHVHQGDHGLEGEGRHVHVAVLLHALGAGAHGAPDAVLAVVAGLRVDGERQADGLGEFIDGVEAAVAEVDAVDIDGEHGAHDPILAMLDQPLQLLDGRRWILAGDEADALQALRVDRQVLLQEPAVDGATQDTGQFLVPQAIDGEGHAGAEDDGDVHPLLVHVREALAGVPLTGPAPLDVRCEGATDTRPQPLGSGRQPSFDIHAGSPMTVGEAYGRPLVVRSGHPGRQNLPRARCSDRRRQ